MILVIDNYDSFTYNLVHYLNELGAETTVYRNDKITVQDALALRPEAVLLSPGPCTPNEAGICLPLISGAPDDLPILGRPRRWSNLVLAVGHGMLGVTNAAGTAQLVAAAVLRRTPPIDPDPYRLERFD